MRATSHTSTPRPTITATSARAAGVAGGGVAGRRLQLAERLTAFREQVALVDRVFDEVPGQQRIEGVGAVDEAVRVHALAPAPEGFQDGPPLLGALVQADQGRRRAPIARSEERRGGARGRAWAAV